MNGFARLILILSLVFVSVRCSTLGQGDDSPATEDSEFSDFDSGSSSGDIDSTSSNSSNEEASLEQELNQSEGAPQEQVAEQTAQNSLDDEFAQFEKQDENKAEEPPPPQIVEAQIEPPPPEESVPPPIVETMPPPLVEEPVQAAKAQITNIRYKANDNGGTLVIDGSQPLQYQTRLNSETNQFIVEVENAILPQKLKRPLNTKDMAGGIGGIDAYQNKGSTTARIVVQLRAGVPEPVIQAEGNSLLVVQTGQGLATSVSAESAASPESEGSSSVAGTEEMQEIGMVKGEGELLAAGSEKGESGILSSASLSEFLTGNTQFYGKPMSLEVSEMDIREVFKLIAEESGVNMILSDDVKGGVTLKLKDVPWDQIFIILMKTKKLGYTRSGSIIRIASMADIRAEEAEALSMIAARKAQANLKVKVLPVSYADIKKLSDDVSKFLSERGKVVGDQRTSSLMITDHDENIERIEKLIKAIDVPPPQVLIEGKIVEATDQFQRQIGVNWSATGQETKLFNSNKIKGRSSIDIAPTTSSAGAAAAQLNFSLGTLDVLGDIDATLSLFETQSQVKVLSSPRIVTLHNEKAEINQSISIPILSETQSTTGTTRTATFKDVSLKLQVTPQITNDASVILDVSVSRSFLGAVADQATQTRPVNTRSAITKVMVRNAQTAVIGGVYQSDQTMGETKVPWIGDIPLLGWLFKNRNTDSNKNELLIFLTPRILGQADSQVVPTELEGVSP